MPPRSNLVLSSKGILFRLIPKRPVDSLLGCSADFAGCNANLGYRLMSPVRLMVPTAKGTIHSS